MEIEKLRDEDLIESIYKDLWNVDWRKRIKAIDNATMIDVEESIKVLELIIKTRNEISLKLHALYVLPKIASPEIYRNIEQILKIAISDKDNEIVRNVLLVIPKLPIELFSRDLIPSIKELLKSNDTDILLFAAKCLLFLKSLISHKEIMECLLPLQNYPNENIRDMANKAIDERKKTEK